MRNQFGALEISSSSTATPSSASATSIGVICYFSMNFFFFFDENGVNHISHQEYSIWFLLKIFNNDHEKNSYIERTCPVRIGFRGPATKMVDAKSEVSLTKTRDC